MFAQTHDLLSQRWWHETEAKLTFNALSVDKGVAEKGEKRRMPRPRLLALRQRVCIYVVL